MGQENSILGGAPGMGISPFANAPGQPPRPVCFGMHGQPAARSGQYPTMHRAESTITNRNHEHDYFSAPGARRYANSQPPQMHTNSFVHPPNQGHFLPIAPASIQPSGPTAQRMTTNGNQEPHHKIFKLSMDIDSSNGQISGRVVYGNGQGQGTSSSARNMEQRSRSRETFPTGVRRPVIRNDFNDRSSGWNMRRFPYSSYDTTDDDSMDTSMDESDTSSVSGAESLWGPPGWNPN